MRSMGQFPWICRCFIVVIFISQTWTRLPEEVTCTRLRPAKVCQFTVLLPTKVRPPAFSTSRKHSYSYSFCFNYSRTKKASKARCHWCHLKASKARGDKSSRGIHSQLIGLALTMVATHKWKNPTKYVDTIRVFPKIGVGPPNHPFVHRFFHYFHHPFWGENTPYSWFNTHTVICKQVLPRAFCSSSSSKSRPSLMNCRSYTNRRRFLLELTW